MSQSEAELTLLINARNLASGVVSNFGKSLEGVGRAAGTMGTKVNQGIQSVRTGITGGLGNLTETLAQGGGLGEAAFAFGAFMAGQAVEAFLENMLERLAESTVVEVIGGALGTIGSTLGSILSSAIAIGAAAFPAVLVALIVGAIVFLINNPEIVNKLGEFAGGVVDWIVKGIGALPGLLLDAIGAAVGFVADNIGPFVQRIVDFFLGIPGKLAQLGANIVTTIIGGLISLPGKVADVVRDAFAKLRIDVGPFHITGQGITIDLPKIDLPEYAPGSHFNVGHKAAGGLIGRSGAEYIRGGENGLEYMLNARLTSLLLAGGPGGGSGVRLEGVTEAELADAIDRRLLFRLRRAPATGARV